MRTPLTAAVLCIALPFAASAQEDVPNASHVAGLGRDTGGGSGYVSTVPIDLPASRGGVPVPVTLTLGGVRMGALGRGGQVQLSYLTDLTTFAHQLPTANSIGPANPRRRVTLQLLGESIELVLKPLAGGRDEEVWVAQRGHPAMTVKHVGTIWRAYTGDGLTYTFDDRSNRVGPKGLFPLDRIEGPGGAKVQLEYTTWVRHVTPPPAPGVGAPPLPLPGYDGTALTLTAVRYNFAGGSPKHEVQLVYYAEEAQPWSVTVLGEAFLLQTQLLRYVNVNSRADLAGPLTRLSRYTFNYGTDPDTNLPRVTSVTRAGRLNTAEANVELPVATYEYGTATTPFALPDGGTDAELRYQPLPQPVALPSGPSRAAFSHSERTAVTPAGSGLQYVETHSVLQQLTDVNGDGRADLVYPWNGQLTLARGRPGSAGEPVLNDLSQLGGFNGGPMTKTTLDVTVSRRFDPFPSAFPAVDHDSITDTWTQLIDIDGDGRTDFVDGREVANAWVVYFNRPAANPSLISWVRRVVDVTHLRAVLENRGNPIPTAHVPLMRQYTARIIHTRNCWEYDYSAHVWVPTDSYGCEGHHGDWPTLEYAGTETGIGWRLQDFNDDGAADLLLSSVAPHSEASFPCYEGGSTPQPGRPECTVPPESVDEIARGRTFKLSREGQLEVIFNAGIQTLLPASQPTLIGGCGPGRWSNRTEICGLHDVNGDGLLDSVESNGPSSTPVAFLGTGTRFGPAYVPLPHRSSYDRVLPCDGTVAVDADLTGFRDLNGDGIPEAFSGGSVLIGTGTGYSRRMRLVVPGADPQRRGALQVTETACDGSRSTTIEGMADLDGDGRPEVVLSNGTSLVVLQLVGRSNGVPSWRAHSAGLITAVENGHGARTELTYRSAKDDFTTPHQVAAPEIVVDTMKTVQRSTGLASQTRYAYGDVRSEFDSVEGRFRSYGYRRTIELTETAPGLKAGDPARGLATVSDRYPLAPVTNMNDLNAVFGRHLIAGRPKSVNVLSVYDGDPWKLLTVDVTSDTRRISGTDYQYETRTFLGSAPTTFPCFDFPDPLLPGQWSAVNTCETYGFMFEREVTAWRGRTAPPTLANVQTHTRVLQVDDYGRPLQTFYGNDARRGDDNVCVNITYADPKPVPVPGGWDGRIRVAPARATVTVANVDGVCTGAVLKSYTQEYDGMPIGLLANGFLTKQWAERRESQTGVLLDVGPVLRFTVQHDAFGNPLTLVTDSGDGRTRTVTRTYDPFGLVETSMTVSAAGLPALTQTTQHDAFTLLPRTVREPNGAEASTEYDGFDREVMSLVKPAGAATSGAMSVTTYLGFGGLAADPLGRRVEVKTFDNPVAPSAAATAPGHVGTTWLDELGRTKLTVARLGADYGGEDLVFGDTRYDAFGHVEFEAEPYGSTQNPATAYGTTYFYNADGTLEAAIRGHGKQAMPGAMFGSTDEAAERYPTFFKHDWVDGRRVETVYEADALLTGSAQYGVFRLSRLTAIGRLQSSETWSSSSRLEHVEHAYDLLGNRISMTRYRLPGSATIAPSEPVKWSFGYDSLGRLLRHQEPNTSQVDFVYSQWGELLERKRASVVGGLVTISTHSVYDAYGRVVRQDQRRNGTTQPDTEYGYFYDVDVSPFTQLRSENVLGRLSAAFSPTSRRFFSYDGLGRPSRSLHRAGTTTYVETAAYDADGAVIERGMMLPDTQAEPAVTQKTERVQYTYDSARRLRVASFFDESGSGWPQWHYQAARIDALGRVREAKVGQALLTQSYADTGRRLFKDFTLTPTVGQKLVVKVDGYDPAGRERSRTETGGTVSSSSVNTYDALGRLKRTRRTGPTPGDKAFAYDALGNIIAHLDVAAGQHVALTYPTGASANLDQLCSIGYGGAAPATCNVQYDGAGNITTQPVRSGGSRTFRYLASGQVERIAQPDGTRVAFRYDPFGEVEELDVTSSPTENRADRRYGMIERRTVTSGGSSATLVTRSYAMGDVLATRLGPTMSWTFAIADGRGGRFVVGETGKVVQEVDYQPYGEPMSSGAAPGAAQHSRLQWNGRDYLASVGLSHLGARLYDPIIGRFLSRDPLVLAGGAGRTNPYAFAFNDPVNFADPSGMSPSWYESFRGGQSTGGGGQDIGDATVGGQVRIGESYQNRPKAPRTLYGRMAKNAVTAMGKRLGDDFDYDSAMSGVRSVGEARDVLLNAFRQYEGEGTAFEDAVGSFGGGMGDTLLDSLTSTLSVAVGVAPSVDLGGRTRDFAGIESASTNSTARGAGVITGVVVDLVLGGKDVVKQWMHVRAVTKEVRAIAPQGGGNALRINNCFSAACTYDANLRGHPASALFRPGAKWRDAVQRLGEPAAIVTGIKRVKAMMAAAGSGRQAIVLVWKEGNRVGHAFNVVNRGGVVVIADSSVGGAKLASMWMKRGMKYAVFFTE